MEGEAEAKWQLLVVLVKFYVTRKKMKNKGGLPTPTGRSPTSNYPRLF